jgi:CrcB protein
VTVLVWLGVAALGGCGALLRFLLDGLVSGWLGRELPLGTFAVNVSGAFALGLVAGATLTGDALLLVGTAVLGSYTTFSTWLLETHRLTEDAELGAAVGNSLISLAVGVCAIALGRALA